MSFVGLSLFATTFSMPPNKKVTGILIGLCENQQSEPSANHISMHSEGTKSFSVAGQPENRNIMAVIK